MTLVQQTINNVQYYTDGANFYTYFVVNSPKTALTEFACRELGIPMKPQFNPDESARINQLAGTGFGTKTVYQFLKNGQAAPVEYHLVGAPKLKQGDILLRKVNPPAGNPSPPAGWIKCPHCSSDTPRGTNCIKCGRQL